MDDLGCVTSHMWTIHYHYLRLLSLLSLYSFINTIVSYLVSYLDSVSDIDEPIRPGIVTKKRSKHGRMTEVMKKMQLSTHELGPDCKCLRFKCFINVKEIERQLIINNFNVMTNFNEQNQYLAGLVSLLPVVISLLIIKMCFFLSMS